MDGGRRLWTTLFVTYLFEFQFANVFVLTLMFVGYLFEFEFADVFDDRTFVAAWHTSLHHLVNLLLAPVYSFYKTGKTDYLWYTF